MPAWLDPFYAATLWPHYLYHRAVTGKYGAAAAEKFGRLPARGHDGGGGDAPCWWLHAVSVGEARAAAPLAAAFRARRPDWDWRVSTTTGTGRGVAEGLFGTERIGYYPLDFSRGVRRAFDAWRPSLITLMELEVWPNFLAEAARRGVPVAVANARVTARSERRLSLKGLGWLRRRLLDGVALWLPQTDEYAERLLRLGVRPERIQRAGSLKYDMLPDAPDAAARAATRARLGLAGAAAGHPLLVAGSTHPSEEETVLAAWEASRKEWPGLRLLVAPRHPERWEAVAGLLARRGPVTRVSALERGAAMDLAARPQLLLGDVMGRLAEWFAAADAAFVGGTLIPHGGQNFMEPCGFGVPTVCGPSLYNFAEAAALLRGVDGFRAIAGAAELAPALADLLRHPAAAAAMAGRGRAALLKQRGASVRTVEAMLKLIGNE